MANTVAASIIHTCVDYENAHIHGSTNIKQEAQLSRRGRECLFVVSFNNTIPRQQPFTISYFGF